MKAEELIENCDIPHLLSLTDVKTLDINIRQFASKIANTARMEEKERACRVLECILPMEVAQSHAKHILVEFKAELENKK